MEIMLLRLLQPSISNHPLQKSPHHSLQYRRPHPLRQLPHGRVNQPNRIQRHPPTNQSQQTWTNLSHYDRNQPTLLQIPFHQQKSSLSLLPI
jgi:hypothetical protein